MRPTRWVLLASVWTFLLTGQIAPGGAQETPAAVRVDLPTALGLALRDNPDLRAKRHTLGLAEGRVQQSELLFQDNPRVSIEADYRNRRFRAPTGRSTADAAVSVLQEIEIAGQPAHRRQAAASHLSYTEWVIADAERLLQLEVMRAFYELLARQEKIQARRDSLETRDALLQAGRERYAQEDISVLDLNALRLDTDETRALLLADEQERVGVAKQLGLLLGLGIEQPLVALGDLFAASRLDAVPDPLPSQAELIACALEHRPDYQAARRKVETREAELRLARANRLPNIALGPMYKLDNEDQVVGGALTIPLPLFNRQTHAITAATAQVEMARQELTSRTLSVRHEVAAAYAGLQLARQQRAVYGTDFFDTLAQTGEFTRRAYEAGELSLVELSAALERLGRSRSRALATATAVLQARATLAARLAFGCLDTNHSSGDAPDTQPEKRKPTSSGTQGQQHLQ